MDDTNNIRLPGWAADCVAIDLEATGKDPRTARIIELAMVEADGSRWESLVYCDPRLVTEFISNLTNITPDDLQDAPSPASVLPWLHAKLQGRVLIGHYVRYDINVLNYEFMRLGLTGFNPRAICTGQMSRAMYKGKTTNNKLETLVNELQLPAFGRAHGAMADTLAVCALLNHMVDKQQIDSMERLLALGEIKDPIKEVGPTISFGKHAGRRWEEIPHDYLRWLLEQPWFDDMQRAHVRELLDNQRAHQVRPWGAV